MNPWITPKHDPENFKVNTGFHWIVLEAATFAFTYLNSRTMLVSFNIYQTSVEHTQNGHSLQMRIPEGRASAKQSVGHCVLWDDGAAVPAGCQVDAGNPWISIYRLDNQDFKQSAGQTHTSGQIIFEVKP